MAAAKKYVAYVGTYTHSNSVGIHVYDVDAKKGALTERSVAPINNPSFLTTSHNGKYLYSIADEGVAAFSIDENGDLTKINQQWIGGMRGDYVEVDSKNRFLFVGGYHDGRVTMMKLNSDGSIGDISCGIFQSGLPISASEKRLDHPKVTCVKLTPDEKYLLAADLGLHMVKVYKIDYELGKLELEDIIRCSMDSGPRALHFSKDGKFLYVLTELANAIEIYKYSGENNQTLFELVKIVPTLKKDFPAAGSTSFDFTADDKYCLVTVDALNTVTVFARNAEDGTLSYEFETMVSGDYPKSIGVLPGNEFYAVLNHDTNEIRTFKVFPEKKCALMENKPVKVSTPNCIDIVALGGEG